MKTEGFLTTEDGLRIWYGLTGADDGPVLALCDGIACDGFIWAYLIDHFGSDYRLLRWHYRGHGRSEAPPSDEGLRLEALARDLHGIARELGLGPLIVIGHSLGVQVGLEFYRRAPELTRALVLVSGSYRRPLATFQGSDRGERLLPWLRSLVERAPRLANSMWARLIPTDLAFRIARWTEIHPTRARRADFMPYLRHVARMDLRVFLGMLTHAAVHDAGDLLGRIAVPSLVMAGDADGFTPAELSRHMAEQIPGAELMLLPGGTHTMPIEFPEAVNRRLELFLAERVLR